MEYDNKNILPSPLLKKKNYLITDLKKMDCDKEKDQIINKIKEQFESIDNFFKIDERIIIGKKILSSTQKSIIESQNNLNEIKQNLRTNTIKLIKNNPTHSASVPQNNNRHRTTRFLTSLLKEKTKIPICLTEEKDFQFLNFNQAKKILEDAKTRCVNSKGKLNDSIEDNKMMKSCDKRNLLKQEKILIHDKRINLRSANISKKISNQIDKNEDDLLMNRVCDFRVKKQIKEIVDNRTPFVEKFGEKGWILNLRREKNPKIVRFNYVNIGTDEKPILEQLNEYPKKKVEIFNSPSLNIKKDLKKFFKNDYLKKAFEIGKFDLERIKELNKFEIEGKNLLDEEFKNINDWKCPMKMSKIRYDDNEMKDEIYKEYYDPYPHKNNFPRCLSKSLKEIKCGVKNKLYKKFVL